MNKKILTWLFVLGATSLQAQTLDLETCLRMADTANLSLRNARLDIEINEEQRQGYMSARLPKLTASGDYKYNAIIPGQLIPSEFFGGPAGTYAKVAFGVPYNLGNTVQLTQILYNPQVNYGLRALEINQKVVETQAVIADLDIKEQVAATFFNLQAIQKQRSFVQGNILSMNKLIANMEAMEQQGLVIATEVDKLRINRLSLQNSEQTLATNQQQLETLLRILIGMPSGSAIQLASDDLVQKSILVDGSAVSYPQLDLIKAQQELNYEERKGTAMAYLPSLAAYAAYNYTYNINPDQDFRTGVEAAFIGLKLDWTLFDGLEKHNKMQQNAITRDKLANQEVYVKQQLDMVSANAKRQIDLQKSSLDIAKQQLELAQKVYAQTEAQFKEGTVSSNDLITADNGLQQAQTNVVSAYVQLRQAELTYLKSIGKIQ